ncbi:MAG: HIT family protein [Lactococcus lactis]|uniref:HIT family protein n=1 Tax=Ruoffia sp. FAM 26254 TaxID=3259518 RepID=UPI00388A5CC0
MEWYENRVLSAINGTNPMLIKELKGGYAVFGDVQFLPGYCVLLPKKEVNSLNVLTLEEREQFLSDMSILGDAIIHSCTPIRVNYDILGNTDNFLHAHVFPRYEWESEERKKMPVWLYDSSNWHNKETSYNPIKHDEIRNSILEYLNKNYE